MPIVLPRRVTPYSRAVSTAALLRSEYVLTELACLRNDANAPRTEHVQHAAIVLNRAIILVFEG